MNDDSRDLELRLSSSALPYGSLHPDVQDRLLSILRSNDPKVRARIGVLVSRLAVAARERTRRLMDRYGLTPSEARVALYITDGGDIASCAAAAGVTEGTVRVQLKAIFAKTGVKRQAALVSLLR